MSLEAGARLGPCEILGPIGAGGMGEVYRDLYDIGTEGDHDYLIMEYLEGETLAGCGSRRSRSRTRGRPEPPSRPKREGRERPVRRSSA